MAETFEEALADPSFQTPLDTEVLPHLLAFGPPVKCPTCRPWLFCPVHVGSDTLTQNDASRPSTRSDDHG